MRRRFENKVVIITGASMQGGIGAAAAERFVDEGASVALAARTESGLEAVAKRIRDRGGVARALPTDLGNIDACEVLLKRAVDAFGGIDVLVNNAGMNVRGPVESQDPRVLAQILQVNLVAPIVLTRLVMPYLRSRGGGSIVQVASIAGQVPIDGEATYSASKFGLRGFSFALHEELSGSGIRVSVVSPGPVDTSFIRNELDSVPDIVFSGPMSTAADVAKLVVECASDGRRERTIPLQTGVLARVAAAFPALKRALTPIMERRGKVAKEAFRARL